MKRRAWQIEIETTCDAAENRLKAEEITRQNELMVGIAKEIGIDGYLAELKRLKDEVIAVRAKLTKRLYDCSKKRGVTEWSTPLGMLRSLAELQFSNAAERNTLLARRRQLLKKVRAKSTAKQWKATQESLASELEAIRGIAQGAKPPARLPSEIDAIDWTDLPHHDFVGLTKASWDPKEHGGRRWPGKSR